MSDDLVLHHDKKWVSPYVFSVFVALEEKGLTFARHPLNLARGEQRSENYLDLSLTARVPTLLHEGAHGTFALSESSAIAEYLEEAFPNKGTALFPGDLRARARIRQVMAFLRSDLLALREERPSDTIFAARPMPPLSRDGQRAAEKLVHLASALIPNAEHDLVGTWSLADADLAFMLMRLVRNGDPVPEHLAGYAERQWARPSVETFVSLPRL